jgi:hypothetical protein
MDMFKCKRHGVICCCRCRYGYSVTKDKRDAREAHIMDMVDYMDRQYATVHDPDYESYIPA